MIRKCYPGGKRKAFNITYDDGVEQDVRFIQLLNFYGLKGTFNLNSELLKKGFTWVHPCGMEIRRLSQDVVREVYRGHEVACHTLTHPDLGSLSREQLLWEMGMDKYYLQEIFGQEICGFAVPFDHYDELAAECARECGFTYVRNSEESHGYLFKEDLLWQSAGVFHLSPDFEAYMEGFLETDQELAFGQVVGHSYDLDTEQMWETMEELLKRISRDQQVWPATHLEVVEYLQAMKQAQITDTAVKNGSSQTLWFEMDGKICRVEPGEEYDL